MNNPLVSVHMITYNHAPYISKAIECVLKQKTNFAIELVIGEDCSTDGTREIVMKYGELFPEIIRIITSDRNVGMRENWNRVTDALRGKYIAWCEGDDYWHREDKLQLQVDYLERNPECGLVFTDYDWYIAKDNKRIQNFHKHSNFNKTISPTIVDIVAKYVDIRTCTVMASLDIVRSVIEKDDALYRENRFRIADIQLWSEISLVAKVQYIDQSLATYQILEESVTQSKDKIHRLKYWISDAELYMYLCDKHNLSVKLRRIYEDNWRRGSMEMAYYENDPELAASVLKKYPPNSFKDYVWYIGTVSKIARVCLRFYLSIKQQYNL